MAVIMSLLSLVYRQTTCTEGMDRTELYRVSWTKLGADYFLPLPPIHPLVTDCPTELQFGVSNKTRRRAVNIAFNRNTQTGVFFTNGSTAYV